MLRAWLRSQFRDDFDIDDIVQEAFLRVLRARAQGEVRSPKAFLFVTARNIALHHFRRRQLVPNLGSAAEFDFSGVLDESADIPHAVSRVQELEMLTKAIQALPTRCRQVLTLRRIYGMSQKEVAAELGIAVHTVEIQTALGLKKIGRYFKEHDVPARPLR